MSDKFLSGIRQGVLAVQTAGPKASPPLINQLLKRALSNNGRFASSTGVESRYLTLM